MLQAQPVVGRGVSRETDEDEDEARGTSYPSPKVCLGDYLLRERGEGGGPPQLEDVAFHFSLLTATAQPHSWMDGFMVVHSTVGIKI